jgi:signal transduction histidine kinase/DNA-binding response OmpR family regulator
MHTLSQKKISSSLPELLIRFLPLAFLLTGIVSYGQHDGSFSKAAPLQLNQQFDQQRLLFNYRHVYEELELLKDTSGELTIIDILQPNFQSQFFLNNSDTAAQKDVVSLFPMPTAYDPEAVYWVKFKAINPTTQSIKNWIMVGWNERSWEQIDAYRVNGNEATKIGKSGLRLPLKKKLATDWRNFVPLELAPQEEAIYYLRLEGLFYPKYADRIDFYYFDEPTYWHDKSFTLFGDGVFLGMSLLLIIFVIAIYYFYREADTLIFTVQLVGIWLRDFADTRNVGASNFFKELFPTALEAGDVLVIIGTTMMLLGLGCFPVLFLKSRAFAPRLSRLIVGVTALSSGWYLTLGIFNFALYPYFEYPYNWIENGATFMLLSGIGLPILVLVLSFYALKQQRTLAKLFIVAYSPIVLIMIGFFIAEILFEGTLSDSDFHLASRVGFLSNYILFTIAIVYKRQLEYRQNSQKRLELSRKLYQEQTEAQRLKELDTFKSRLYTNITHEFRTPLTVILGMVNQMREAPKKYFEEGTLLIERNGKNLLRLINQLLDLSKLESNSLQLNWEQDDIISYLRYMTESFQTYANGQNVSLQFFSTVDYLEMDFDAEQIKQVMTNLISNAVKFTPSGGAIKVKASQSNDQLEIVVEDTGVGIAAADIVHVFDRFYQADTSATRKGEGTGIGLAHAQELVQLMKGNIDVESRVGIGSVFRVTLPISNQAAKAKVSKEQIDSLVNVPHTLGESEGIGGQNGKRPQLLIMEDNADVVTYLKSCLSDYYQMDIAYNGKIGIEKAITNIPDIIISDVMMPEKDGYEVCEILKNDERTSHIPIILLTAKADQSSKIVGLSRGADAYLSKPFDKKELLIRLNKMAEKQRKLAAYFKRENQVLAGVETQLEEAIQVEHKFIQKVRNIVAEHYTNDRFGLPQLCQKIGMSRSQLYRKMKALIDVSPSEFIRTYRLEQAKLLLETTDLNVSEVAWETGFTNLSHFTKAFQEMFGELPSQVKQ